MKILELQPALVVPMAPTHLWSSYFRRTELVRGEPMAMTKPFRRGPLDGWRQHVQDLPRPHVTA